MSTPNNFSTHFISKNKIISEIKVFFNENKRIPIKKEYHHYRAARLRFGSWNNAITAAGFQPNPVIFSKKHIALDGHKCDSVAEFVIDNWLTKHNIVHQVHIPYENTHFYSDFKIDDTIIEFIGLEGESKKYDHSLKEKRKLIKELRLKVIEIFPEDLFPKNKLEFILTEIIK